MAKRKSSEFKCWCKSKHHNIEYGKCNACLANDFNKRYAGTLCLDGMTLKVIRVESIVEATDDNIDDFYYKYYESDAKDYKLMSFLVEVIPLKDLLTVDTYDDIEDTFEDFRLRTLEYGKY